MKNFIKSKIGIAIISGVTVAVIAIILWPLFDILYCQIFTHSEFNWNVQNHLVQPILVGVFFGIFEYVFDINKIRATRKSK